MKRSHFDAFRPFCPYCRQNGDGDHPLRISFESRADANQILEGALQCTHAACLGEFPILDGIPILLADPGSALQDQRTAWQRRTDLSEELNALLGEYSGPDSELDTIRRQLSQYVWDHWGEFDPAYICGPGQDRSDRGPSDRAGSDKERSDRDRSDQESSARKPSAWEPAPGGVVRLLEKARELGATFDGAVCDLGCGVGRGTFELARQTDDLVLGVDLGFGMLRQAMSILQTGRVAYAQRMSGMLYDWREFDVPLIDPERVDFWLADASALPVADGRFGAVSALNLLDCVGSPGGLLREIERILGVGGCAVLATPFDWSGNATETPAWIGGRSPRGPAAGDSAALLQALLTPGAHPASMESLVWSAGSLHEPWFVRLHDRSHVRYSAQLVIAQKTKNDR